MTAQQLKNSILQLAVQGKLVPQDPNDEPVKVAPYTGDTPFDVPQNWVWAKLGDAFYMQAGKFVKACDIYEDNNSERYPCYGGNGLRGYVDTFNTEGSFPLIGRQGALCGNVNMAKGRFYATEHAVVAKPNADIDVNWAYYALTSLNLNQYSTATAQPGLAVSKISYVPVSIPPLAEQHRIVERIEQLLPHISDYDVAEQNLTALSATFPDQLKKSILQAAVQGKLVPQDENDEPASVLLERIRAEKEQLIKDGKLKKEKPLPPISDDEIPFDLPESWEWARLGEIISVSSGKGLTLSQMDKQGVFPVYGGNGITGYHSESNVNSNTLVIGRVGFYCGATHITYETAWVTDNALIVSFPKAEVNIHWLRLFIDCSELRNMSSSTAQPLVSGKLIYPLLFPLPPLAEQHCIVARVEELLSLVAQCQ